MLHIVIIAKLHQMLNRPEVRSGCENKHYAGSTGHKSRLYPPNVSVASLIKLLQLDVSAKYSAFIPPGLTDPYHHRKDKLCFPASLLQARIERCAANPIQESSNHIIVRRVQKTKRGVGEGQLGSRPKFHSSI